jgi:putative phosphoesterase
MKVAIFSDVHGNLSALEAVLESVESQAHVDQIVFAGDIGVAGPRPDACLDLLRGQQIQAVVGNTDEWILNPPQLVEGLKVQERERRFNLQAICNWTRGQLDDESLSWVERLRQSFSITLAPNADPADELLIVHANPIDLAQIIFPSEQRQLELYSRIRQSDADLEPLVSQVRASTIAFGHLHIPNVRAWHGKRLVNVSSVSLPGDGDPRAKYAILTWNKASGWQAEHVYVPYDYEGEIAAFSVAQPPGWQESMKLLETSGFIPQIV